MRCWPQSCPGPCPDSAPALLSEIGPATPPASFPRLPAARLPALSSPLPFEYRTAQLQTHCVAALLKFRQTPPAVLALAQPVAASATAVRPVRHRFARAPAKFSQTTRAHAPRVGQ